MNDAIRNKGFANMLAILHAVIERTFRFVRAKEPARAEDKRNAQASQRRCGTTRGPEKACPEDREREQDQEVADGNWGVLMLAEPETRHHCDGSEPKANS